MDIDAYIYQKISFGMDLIHIDESSSVPMLTFSVNITDYHACFIDQAAISTLQLDQFVNDIKKWQPAVLSLSDVSQEKQIEIILEIDPTLSKITIYYLRNRISSVSSGINYKNSFYVADTDIKRFYDAFDDFPRWW